MPLSLRPATEADCFRIGCISRDAFRGSLSSAIFPPHLHSKSETGDPGLDEVQWRADRTLRRMRDGKPTFVAVETPEDGGEETAVVGFAQWDAPAPGGHWEADSVPPPGSMDEAVLRKLYETVETEIKRALGPEGYSNMWYLMSVAIDPAHQRRGIGRMLVLHGLDLAAKEGLDVFLIATPEGEGLYRSLGFQPVGEPFDLIGTRHLSMLWKHQSVASP